MDSINTKRNKMQKNASVKSLSMEKNFPTKTKCQSNNSKMQIYAQ